MRFLPVLTFSALFVIAACVKAQAPAPVTHYGIAEGAGSAGAHTVIAGDTLYRISQRYNIAVRDIATVNHLSPPFHLANGQRLLLPPPQQYRVRAGDSLYTVSRLFGVSTSDIAEQNNLRNPYILSSGQVLRLPSVAGGEPAVTAAVAPVVTAEVLPPPAHVPQIFSSGGVEVSSPVPPQKPVQVAGIEPPEHIIRKSPVTAKTPARSSSKFLRPVEGKILSAYGPKNNGLHNDGINIAAPKGAPVRAAENGVVVYAGNELKGSGNLVLIRHADRWTTAYAHLGNIQIKRGDAVRRGQTIGTVGTTGSVDSPQLHFEVRRGTAALNPQPYMESKA